MKLLKNALAIVCLLLCLIGTATAQDKLGFLKNWIGRYPTDETRRPPRKFFHLGEIQRRLLKLISRKDFNRLARGYRVESTFQPIDDYLAVTTCLAHLCDKEHAIFAVNLHDGTMYVGFYDFGDAYYDDLRGEGSLDYSKGKTRWFSTKAFPIDKDIPQGIVKLFSEMHTKR